MKLALGLKITALIPFGLLAILSLLMSAVEIWKGNFSEGLWSLAGVAFFGLLILIAWKGPYATGVKLVFGGILFVVFSILNRNPEEGRDGFVIGAVALVTGFLLLFSKWVTPKDPE